MIRAWVFLALAVLAGCSGGSATSLAAASPTPNAANSFPEPPVVYSTSGLLHVTLSAAIDPATNAPSFVYNGQ
jgi:hypothetical protein